ncbi:MAG: hypothetical protein ACREON_11730 [Gemmatimonadaceae bacterium]
MGRSLVATLLSVSFALQLLLAGGGVTCVMTAGGATGGGTTPRADAMPETGMTDMSIDMSMPTGGAASASSDDSGSSTAPDEAPCDQPATPAACVLTAPCAVSFIVVLSAAADAESRSPSRIVTMVSLEPPSHSDPPELPPPRA